jgi:hypothetical protein
LKNLYLQDPHGKVPFFWGIAADGNVAFSDDAKLLKQGCGKSFAPFPQGISRSIVNLLRPLPLRPLSVE